MSQNQPLTVRAQTGMSRLTYTLFLILTVGIGLEITLRILDPIGIWYLYEVRRYFETMLVPDERYAYIHKADYRDTLQGVPVSYNSHGLRWPEFPVRKPDDKLRLMVLGDSVVFGWGVDEELIFPARLQEKFDALDASVEIVSAGVGSWNTRTEYEYLRHVSVEFQPDVLLLLIVPNDTDPKRDSGHTAVPRSELFPDKKKDRNILENAFEDFWRSAARRSYLAAYIKYFWQERIQGHSGEPIDEQSPQWRDARMALDGIIDLCRERGIHLILYLDGSDSSVKTHPILSLYKNHIESRGLQGLTVPEGLPDNPEYRNSVVDSHMNAAGHAVLAEAMFRELKSRLADRLSAPETLEPQTKSVSDP